MKFAGKMYIPKCDSIIGEIGSLEIDDAHMHELCDIHIDTLMLDLIQDEVDYDEFGVQEAI